MQLFMPGKHDQFDRVFSKPGAHDIIRYKDNMTSLAKEPINSILKIGNEKVQVEFISFDQKRAISFET